MRAPILTQTLAVLPHSPLVGERGPGGEGAVVASKSELILCFPFPDPKELMPLLDDSMFVRRRGATHRREFPPLVPTVRPTCGRTPFSSSQGDL